MTALASSLVCTRTSTSPTIIQLTFNFGSVTNVQANELLSFTIADCVNPSTTESSSAFGLSITNTNGFGINTYSGSITLTTAEAAQLIDTSLLSSSSVALANVNIEFTFTLAHDFPSAGVIYIYYPETVGFNSTNFA